MGRVICVDMWKCAHHCSHMDLIKEYPKQSLQRYNNAGIVPGRHVTSCVAKPGNALAREI